MFQLFLRFTLLICCLGGYQITFGQILDCSKPLFQDEPFFNVSEIQKQKVKSITGEKFYKRDYEKMNSRGVFVQYNFDTKGRLINQISTVKKYGGITDTLIIMYEYDDKNRLITTRKGDAFGYYSLNYNYNDSNQITKETYCRDINKSPWQCTFELDKQYPMAVETFDYHYLTKNQVKVKYLNNIGLAYKETMIYKDDKNRIVEKSGRLITTGKMDKTVFEFNTTGQVIKKSEWTDVSSERKVDLVYKFDDANVLIEIEKFKNNVLMEHTEFLFENNIRLFSAKLTRDLELKQIEITKYYYEFYD